MPAPVSPATHPNGPETSSFSPRGLWSDLWRRFCHDRAALFGAIVLGIIMIAVSFGPIAYHASATEIDFARSSLSPSLAHPCGTNDLGQDQLARLLMGGRVSLAVGLAAMSLAMSLGTTIGAIAGFYGGLIDTLLMRLTDLFLSLPQLPLLLLVVYLFRDSLSAIAGPETSIFLLVIVLIGGLNWMSVARLVRAGFLTTRSMDYVTAARALGASPLRLIFVHILPNIIGTVIVAATLGVGSAIVTESTLSFLGLGFPPDVPTWGRMLYDAQNHIMTAPYQALFPGLAIFLTVLSINYIGDGLRDAFDPKSPSPNP
jgi:peptide/nickel transport system permease protein